MDCIKCHSPRVPGDKRCSECAKAYHTKRRAGNVCCYCTKVSPEDGFKSCKVCKEKMRIRSIRHADASAKWHMDDRQKKRQAFFKMYGMVCACCEEGNTKFLTIEHIIPLKRRKTGEVRGYNEIVKALIDYRPDLYETLCYNCNCGRNANKGICPHEIEEGTAL